jgi:hypothetical protein
MPCKLCRKVLKTPGNTSHLMRHLHRLHKNQVAVKEQDKTTTSGRSNEDEDGLAVVSDTNTPSTISSISTTVQLGKRLRIPIKSPYKLHQIKINLQICLDDESPDDEDNIEKNISDTNTEQEARQ